MVLLNGVWICSTTYYTSLLRRNLNPSLALVAQAKWENTVATAGNVFFAIHDWVFTEQYLLASFMMPLALNMIATDEDDFDASQYYYNRHGSTGAPPGSGAERPAFHKYTYF